MAFEWRPHRGGLAEAMAEKRTFDTFEDMAAFLRDDWGAFGASPTDIQAKWYANDERINWDTYIVTGTLPDGTHAVLGFTNGNPADAPPPQGEEKP